MIKSEALYADMNLPFFFSWHFERDVDVNFPIVSSFRMDPVELEDVAADLMGNINSHETLNIL